MSTTQPRLPAFVSRPGPDNDVYETNDYYETGQISYGEQFMEAFFREFASQGGTPFSENRYVPPPPNEVPARPGYDTPGDYSYTGFRVLPPFRKNPGNAAEPDDNRRAPKPGIFFLFFEDASGRYFIGARVTRKLIFAFLVAIMLITLGLESIPGALDFLVNVIW